VVHDGAGNKIDVQKNFSEKEKKKSSKDLEKKLNDSIKKGTMTGRQTCLMRSGTGDGLFTELRRK